MLFPPFSILVLVIITSMIPVSAEPCNCVIFRFVDVQDFYLNAPRIAVMDTFIDQNEKVSLSIILNSIENDTSIINKVAQGQLSGHFELTLHGFNHENFVTFNATEQRNLMALSQLKMNSLWGVNSTSFVPPMHQWNNDTLQVLKDLKIPIISAGPQGIDPPENIKFIANPPSNITDGFGNYHLPQTSEFYDHGVFPHVKIPHDNIMAAVDAAVLQYGYSVLNLYGTDFAEKFVNGTAKNITNSTEINDLLTIFNATRDKGYTITTFEEITNAGAIPETTVTINNATLPEGNSGTGNFVFTVTRSSNVGAISVQYQTADVSASSPSDYTSLPLTTLNFADGGPLTQTITVLVNGDTTGELDETFNVNLSNCIGCNIIDAQGVGTITNDDILNDLDSDGIPDLLDAVNIINSSKTITTFHIVGNITVQNGAVLTVPNGLSITITSGSNITIEQGGGVLIKSGGALQVNS